MSREAKVVDFQKLIAKRPGLILLIIVALVSLVLIVVFYPQPQSVSQLQVARPSVTPVGPQQVSVSPTPSANAAIISGATNPRVDGYSQTSPHFRDENGKAYLDTWNLVWKFTKNELSLAFPDMNCDRADRLEACKDLGRQRATKSYDLILGNAELMNRSINSTGRAYRTENYLSSVAASTDPSSLYQYLVNYAADSSHNITFTEMVSGCSGDINQDNGRSCSIIFGDSRVGDIVANYWKSASLISSYKAQGYNGWYSDSGVNLGNNWLDFLSNIKQAYSSQSFDMLLNTGDWTTATALFPRISGGIQEHYLFNGYESANDDRLSNQRTKNNWLKTNSPNAKILIQGGFYGDCYFFKDWAGRKSYPLTYRLQIGSLVTYYLLRDPSLYMPYRYSGSYDCLSDENSNFSRPEPAPWVYDERGNLPIGAASFNVGQPVVSNPDSAIKVFANVNYDALEVTNWSSRPCQTAVKKFNGQILEREFQHARLYLRPPQPYGWMQYQDCQIFDKARDYFNERSRSRPLEIEEPLFIVGPDGSFVGPTKSLVLMPAEAAIMAKSGLKLETFVPAQFDSSLSVSKWQTPSSGSYFKFPALSTDEILSGGHNSRPAQVVLEKNVEGGSTKIEYLNNLDLNLGGSYDLDKNIYFFTNMVDLDSQMLPAFNGKARITMVGRSLKKPQILRDTKACSDCKIETYSGNKIVFIVNGFSRYDAVEQGEAAPDYGNYKKGAGKKSSTQAGQGAGTDIPSETSPLPIESLPEVSNLVKSSRLPLLIFAWAGVVVSVGSIVLIVIFRRQVKRWLISRHLRNPLNRLINYEKW